MASKDAGRPSLTHVDKDGQAKMVDVGSKAVTQRSALVEGHIVMQPATFDLIKDQGLKKGDALVVARIAGIQAAKQTSNLIPLCHPLALSKVDIDFEWMPPDTIAVRAFVKCEAKTGVEMEALTAASTALLCIYDMAKAVDRGMQIASLRLLEKRGGRSGDYVADAAET